MDAIDWSAVLEGVKPAEVVLPALFLTVPGIALSRGLRKFRQIKAPRKPAKTTTAGRPEAAKQKTEPKEDKRTRRQAERKGARQRLVVWCASVVTIVAMAIAGLGLVPATLIAYKAIAGVSPYAPAVTGVVMVVLLLARGLVMAKDLKDGRVDKPAAWLAGAPILAVLALVFPVVWGQMTDQASQGAQAILGGVKNSISDSRQADKADKKPHHHDSGDRK